MPMFNSLEEAFAYKPGHNSLLPPGFATRHHRGRDMATATVPWIEVLVVTTIDSHKDSTKCDCMSCPLPEDRIHLSNHPESDNTHGSRWMEMNHNADVNFDTFHGRMDPWANTVHDSQLRNHFHTLRKALPEGQVPEVPKLAMMEQQTWILTREKTIYKIDVPTNYVRFLRKMLLEPGWRIYHLQRFVDIRTDAKWREEQGLPARSYEEVKEFKQMDN